MHTEPLAPPAANPRRRIVEWADPRLTARAGHGLAGLDFLRALIAGEIPAPPAIALLGITFVSADPDWQTGEGA